MGIMASSDCYFMRRVERIRWMEVTLDGRSLC